MRKYIKRKSCPVIIHTYVHTHTYEFTHVRTYINALASHIPYISSYCIPQCRHRFLFLCVCFYEVLLWLARVYCIHLYGNFASIKYFQVVRVITRSHICSSTNTSWTSTHTWAHEQVYRKMKVTQWKGKGKEEKKNKVIRKILNFFTLAYFTIKRP